MSSPITSKQTPQLYVRVQMSAVYEQFLFRAKIKSDKHFTLRLFLLNVNFTVCVFI